MSNTMPLTKREMINDNLTTIQDAVTKLEEVVDDLENELKRRAADLKVMKLMAAQCVNATDKLKLRPVDCQK